MADAGFVVVWAKQDSTVAGFTQMAVTKYFAEERVLTGFLTVTNVQLPPQAAECSQHPESLAYQKRDGTWVCVKGFEDECEDCSMEVVKRLRATITYGSHIEHVVINGDKIPSILDTSADEYFNNFTLYKEQCERVRCGVYKIFMGEVQECVDGPYDHDAYAKLIS